MINYENVFWDWNGTLLDDATAGYESLKILLKKRGMPIPDFKTHSAHFRFPVIEYYEYLNFDFERETYADIADEFTENYLLQKRDLRTGAKKILEKLFLNSVKQFILSASERNLLVSGLKKYNLGVYFTDIIALDNVKAISKVEAGREYIESHDIKGRCLIVGDTEHDFEVARELNMDCVLIESGYNSLERLEKTGAKIIKDLGELSEIILGRKSNKSVDYMTPERAERRSFDLSETNRRFKEKYREFYNDVKNTNATEDW